jgi:hypothetical protein
MSTPLTLRSTLLEYDGPVLMLMVDSNGNQFLVYEDVQDGEHDYIGLPISESKSLALVEGRLSVRDAVLSSPLYPRYLGLRVDSGAAVFRLLAEISAGELSESSLPDLALVLEPESAAEANRSYASQSANLSATLSLQPEEAERRHVVHLDTLADVLKNTQRLIRRAFQQATKHLTATEKVRLRDSGSDTFNAVAFGAGSFEVYLQPDTPGDLFGQNDGAAALGIVTRLMREAGSAAKTIELLREHRGHFASSYVRLLEAVVAHSSPTSLSWSDGSGEIFGSGRVSVEQAAVLIAAIRASSELTTEEVRVTGALIQANEDSGRWKLRSSDNETFSGESILPFSLEGKVIGRLHTFRCREVIEEEAGTGKEKTRLYAFEDLTPQSA